ncbi:MAG: hypothetical protein ACRD3L_14240 [Terriglobales bacterium]
MRHSLTLRSGYIFSGTVRSVQRVVPQNAYSVAVMRITFHVDKGLRGTRTGQTLVVREWAGLWQSGDHYRPGERVMLFLYPPSKLGLTSPVGGAFGRFPVDPNGQVIVEPGRPGHTHAHSREPIRLAPRKFLRMLLRPDYEE